LLIGRTGLGRAAIVAAVTLVFADAGGRADVTAANTALNVAAAANGGLATAASSWPGYPPGAVNNGDRRGTPYGGGGTWSDGTGNVFPDWVQVDFAGAKTIEKIDVIALQDNRSAPVEPTPTLTCTGCPLDFTVQYWTGTSWQAVPNGVVRNNTLVWRVFTFAPLTTSKIRVLVERSATGWAELAEIEAYTAANVPPTVSLTTPIEGAASVAPATFTLSAQAADTEGPVTKVQFLANGTLLFEDTASPFAFNWTNIAPGTYTVTAVAFDGGGLSTTSVPVHVTVAAVAVRVNVAAAANGGLATAASSWPGYPPGAVNNGDRRGAPYGGSGTWSDGTGNVFPDWVQVDFAGARTIDEIDVIALQDNRSAPVEPTPTLTCTGCPLDFTVQYWTGASWQAVPNGLVRNNARVWRVFTFAPLTTSKIRVLVERSATGWAELAEVEAYTAAGGAVNVPPTVSLITPLGGATFTAPARVAMAASAADSDGTVVKVDFYAGAILVGSDTSPSALAWTTLSEGTYLVKAVATDDKGAIATSTSSITVSANAAPFVSLTSPTASASFVAPASILLGATASDPDGTVQKVEFYSGATLLAAVSSPPYAYTWTGVAAGTYSVSAVAYDNLGTKTVSPWRDLTVTTGVILSKAVFVPATVPDYVRNYVLEIFAAGADPAVSTPVARQDVGLPAVVQGECTVDIRNTILGLAPGSYVATVSAITSQGSTLRSNSFAFTR
jgi:hypothetical protein